MTFHNTPYIQAASLAPLVQQLRTGELALGTMLADYQARFEAIEPHIQSFIPEAQRFERLALEAQTLENQYPDPAKRPALYGVLVGIKDIFHVDGFVTRAGTQVPPEHFAGAEAALVTQLRQAGALIAGKTVTTEFAYFEPGPTRNPHHLEHTTGGSSSGSAAAVAAGLIHLATGTQTVGSVIRPAAYCGVVGFKPSFDRIDPNGLVYFSRSADTVGLFTQDIAGMQIAAAVLVKGWRDKLKLTGKPILAVPEGAYLQQATALPAFEAQVKMLEAAGYTVKRLSVFPDYAEIDELHSDMTSAELAIEHAERFTQYENLYRPRTARWIRRGQEVSAERLQAGRASRLITRDYTNRIMQEHGVDLWISPAAVDVAPVGIAATGNPAMNLLWTHSGLPALTVPAGTGELDLPLGLQISAAFGDDERLLAWAQRIASVFN
jgi:Asp-tRNA(Asn)/Glu-tRNA(Gln) amidotransferase A subunit family amidase